jgi:hypothetical protein
MALSIEARELFLAEPHVAALPVVTDPDEGPLAVPIWYQYAPGGELWVLTPAASRKAHLIRAAGRFTILVDRPAPSVRYVSVEGPVRRIASGTRHDLRLTAAYSKRPDLVYALVTAVERLENARGSASNEPLSVRSTGQRSPSARVTGRLTAAEVQSLVQVFADGTPKATSAEQYGISLSSVKRLLRGLLPSSRVSG